jgi:uncharacterized protein (TIGR03000 family)
VRDFFHRVFSFGGCSGCQGGCMGCMGCGGCMGCQGMACFATSPMVMGCMGCMGCAGMSCMGCMGGMPMGMPVAGMNCFGGVVTASYDMPLSGMLMAGAMPTGFAPSPIGGMPGWDGMPMTPSTVPAMPFGGAGSDAVVPAPGAPGNIPIGPPPRAAETVTPPNQATVVVTLPADARLYVENQLMNLTGAVRVFRTPPLSGKTNKYTLRMEVERGGRMVDETKEVELEPGKTSRVHFAEPGSAGSAARINVTVPENAALTVEGQIWPTGERSIVTPPLARDRQYVYQLRLERERDGQKETIIREVSFRAGEVVQVDFDSVPKSLVAR